MNTRKQWVTLIVIIAVTVALSTWDIALVTDGETGNTISAVMNEIGSYTAAALGYLMGHFFFPKLSKRPEELRFDPPAWFSIGAGLLLVGVFWLSADMWESAAHWISFSGLLVGCLVGGICWPNMGNEGE